MVVISLFGWEETLPKDRNISVYHNVTFPYDVQFYVVARPSVCLSVTFMRPTQTIEIFGNVSMPVGTIAIR